MRCIFIVFACVLILIGCHQKDFHLHNGDLLFQANEASQLTNAIKGAGEAYDGLAFSHVGIVAIDGKDTIVIEAVPDRGVVFTSLKDFLTQSAKSKHGKPLVCIGRLLPEYETIIEQSVMRAKMLEGKAYDSVFLPDNDAFYCSELVYECFRDNDGNPVFESSPMSFKNKQTNEFYPAWVDFFANLNIPIPEGVAGTNPNDMSRAKSLKIICLF